MTTAEARKKRMNIIKVMRTNIFIRF